MHLPNITNKVGPTSLASQPITTAFRIPVIPVDATAAADATAADAADGHIHAHTPAPSASAPSALYMGVDSSGASSGLWRSVDDGVSWEDTHGRSVWC